MRLFLGLAAVLAVTFAASAHAAGPPPTPAWMSETGDRMAVVTTGDWTDMVARKKARVVDAIAAGIPRAGDPIDRQGRANIWASTCEAAEQTVRLRRTVVIPGPVGGPTTAFITPQVA